MNQIIASAIKIAPNRQRRVFDEGELRLLAESIRERGLYHPIVLRIVGDDYVLISGERRLRAMQDIISLGGRISHDGAECFLDSVPYTTLGDLDEVAAEEAELEENIRRVDLSWQERAAAHARLERLRRGQAAASGSAPPTVADIALEVRGSAEGSNQEATRRELIVARHLGDPEVAAAKTVDDAFKLLKRKESSARDRELGAAVGRNFTAAVHQAIHEDALRWLTECPEGQFDVILTDPPYGMGADGFGDSGGKTGGGSGNHAYVDDAASFTRILSICQTELLRITKPQAHLYWFCDLDNFHAVRLAFSAAGWRCFRTPLIWLKRTAYRAPWPQHGPQRKYETLLYAIKGDRPALRLAGDVLDYAPDTNLGHAAQKPVALLEDLLRRSVHPGDRVLDPFMGSGSIFPAAHSVKCAATGVELDQGAYGIAVARLEALKAQLELAT